ncbi:hypothetical protein VPH35_101665 [Triticum aestivum]
MGQKFCYRPRLAAARLLEVDQRWRLELLERRRRRLELVDRRANLSNSSKEDATRCLVWLGDLIDAKKLGGSAAGSDTLHLPVAGVATAARPVLDASLASKDPSIDREFQSGVRLLRWSAMDG